VAVCSGQDDAQGDPGPVDQCGPLQARLATVDRGPAGVVPAAWRLDDAPVDRDVGQVQAHEPVVGLQLDLPDPREDSGVDPLVAALTQRGRRDPVVTRDAVGATEDQTGEELVEHDPVRDPPTMTAQRVGDLTVGDQRLELDPGWFEEGVETIRLFAVRGEGGGSRR
jgi:hypothetical protein